MRQVLAYLLVSIYRVSGIMLLPVILILLLCRVLRRKELLVRCLERFTVSPIRRPKNKLIWLHAASIGEMNLAFDLINAFKQNSKGKKCSFLVTTQTLSAAKVFKLKDTTNCIHQFMPLDISVIIWLFLRKWQPDIAIFLESEIWPEILLQVKCPTYLANARMSNKSHKYWRVLTPLARLLFKRFTTIFASSKQDQQHITIFNDNTVLLGHLKQASPPLPYDVRHYKSLSRIYSQSPLPLVVLASIAGDEISLITQTIKDLQGHCNIILIPRHIKNAAIIAKSFRHLRVLYALRSKTAQPSLDKVYIADTYNELGLFYALADCIFVCGSFSSRQGQNMLEALRFNKPVIVGPNTRNFQSIMQELLANNAIVQVRSQTELKEKILVLSSPQMKKSELMRNIKKVNKNNADIMKQYMQYLTEKL